MSKRILVVEDNEDNRRIMRDLLEASGFEPIEAITGEDGLAAAKREKPDLILMDIQLPLMDGASGVLWMAAGLRRDQRGDCMAVVMQDYPEAAH